MPLIRRVSNFIFGSSCLGCGLFTEKLDPWLCPNCREELVSLGKEPYYPQEDVVCLYSMNPLTRRLVHALKYHTNLELNRLMSAAKFRVSVVSHLISLLANVLPP